MITREVFDKYLKKGWSVFPVQITKNGNKYDKKPLVKWMDYMSRMPDKTEVDVWFGLFQEFNGIGLATGKQSGVVVLDIDDPGNDYGFSSLVSVKTISGGKHLYFKYRPGIRNTVRVAGKPIDVRGDGGFVVLPPSFCNEAKYEWSGWDFDHLTDFPFIPEPEISAERKDWSSLPSPVEGERNQTAISVIGHILAKVKHESWETIAWPRFRTWNIEQVTPPLDDFELKSTYDSATRMELTHHAEKHETHIHLFSGKQAKMVYEERMTRYGEGLSTGYASIDEYFKFMPEHIYLFSGQTSQGKTTLSLNMAARIASFGNRVLYCALESGLHVVSRVEAIIGGDVPETLTFLESDRLVGVEAIIETVGQMADKPRIVFIDHLHFMKKKTDIGVTASIDDMIIAIQNASKTMQIPIVVVAHVRKLTGQGDKPTLDDLRDSSSLSQVPSVVLFVHREKSLNPMNDKTFLNRDGLVMIQKNRVMGKTGFIHFNIQDDGIVKIGGD